MLQSEFPCIISRLEEQESPYSHESLPEALGQYEL